MKDWLAKLRAARMGPWVLTLVLCAAALVMLRFFPASDRGMTAEEARISRTLQSISGAGTTRLSVYYAQESAAFGNGKKTPVGAVVVARGADSVAVRLRLQRAAETLLGLAPGQVEVFAMEDAE